MKFIVVLFSIVILNHINSIIPLFQNNIDELLRSVNIQFKKNCIDPNGIKSAKTVDLQGTDLLIYDSDGNKQVFDLKKTKVTSEYDSGKYIVKFTCLYDCSYYYNEKGVLTVTRSIGYFFNSFENAILTRNTIRKITTIVNS